MKCILLSFLLSFFFFSMNAQNNSVCLVKYKELKYKTLLGTFNHWYGSDKMVSLHEPNFRNIHMRGFPVLINDVMTTQTDTVRYNNEFNEFVHDMELSEKSRPLMVNEKYYASNIYKTSLSAGSPQKNYIIVDTLDNVDNWEILNDTLTILGFKCQKATINYKLETYTAWFTSQLPYAAGPDYFRGLPGLILKVSNGYGNNGYEAIEIHTPFKGAIPVFNSDGMSITKSEYTNIINEGKRKAMESMNNLMEQLKTPEGKQALINQYKKPAETQKP